MKGLVFPVMAACLILAVASNRALSNGGAVKTDEGVQISPQTLVLGDLGCVEVTVHTTIPFGAVSESVLPTLTGPDGTLTATDTFADDRGELVVKFLRAAVEDIVSVGPATLTLEVTLKDGTVLAGADTILVMNRKGP